MPVQQWLPVSWWADEENKRLLLMVGVSLTLHVGVLALWKARVASGSMTKSELSVFLPRAPSVSVAPAEDNLPLPATPEKIAVPMTPVVAKPATVAPLLPPSAKVSPATLASPSSAPSADHAPIAAPQQVLAKRQADGVTVILRVNAEGKVIQIFWNRLPAIDNAQFDRLEQSVRARQYGTHVSDRTISEIIDVRGLLSLPPAQSEVLPNRDGVSPAPTDELGATNPR